MPRKTAAKKKPIKRRGEWVRGKGYDEIVKEFNKKKGQIKSAEQEQALVKNTLRDVYLFNQKFYPHFSLQLIGVSTRILLDTLGEKKKGSLAYEEYNKIVSGMKEREEIEERFAQLLMLKNMNPAVNTKRELTKLRKVDKDILENINRLYVKYELTGKIEALKEGKHGKKRRKKGYGKKRFKRPYT